MKLRVASHLRSFQLLRDTNFLCMLVLVNDRGFGRRTFAYVVECEGINDCRLLGLVHCLRNALVDGVAETSTHITVTSGLLRKIEIQESFVGLFYILLLCRFGFPCGPIVAESRKF